MISVRDMALSRSNRHYLNIPLWSYINLSIDKLRYFDNHKDIYGCPTSLPPCGVVEVVIFCASMISANAISCMLLFGRYMSPFVALRLLSQCLNGYWS